MNRYASRKFLLTLLVLLLGTAGWYASCMTGAEYVAFCTLVLGEHHWANNASKQEAPV